MRQRVANELLETERSYVKNLQIVEELLIAPLNTAAMNGARILKDSEQTACFANLIDILSDHKVLLQALEERFSNWTDDSAVADIFLDRVCSKVVCGFVSLTFVVDR